MNEWIIFTVLYAAFSGIYNCTQKKAIEKNTIYEVLAVFTTIAFLLVAMITRDAFNIDFKYLLIIFVKSFIIACSWILSLKAIKKMSVSIYGLINLSKILFAIILSLLLLKEKLTLTLLLGAIIVIIGLFLVNKISNQSGNKEASIKSVILLLIACFFSAVSAMIDKKILVHINSGQLQFWFLFFLAILYWIVLLTRKQKINNKALCNNYWIIISAIALIIGDRFLFIATKMPESKMSIITIINQLSVIETIVLGKIMFKEKNIIKKLIMYLSHSYE